MNRKLNSKTLLEKIWVGMPIWGGMLNFFVETSYRDYYSARDVY